MSLTAGSRVQHLDGEATGTIERVRPSSPSSDGDYMVAEVLWDTGARCPEPLSWLGSIADVQAARKAERDKATELRRLQREQARREHPEIECDGCRQHFRPTRKGQRFHSKSCANKARRLGIA